MRCINIINIKFYTYINNVNILYKKYLFIQNIVGKTLLVKHKDVSL